MNRLALHDYWGRYGAQFGEHFGYELPNVFSTLEEEYNEALHGCALYDFSYRGKIIATGHNRTEVLHRILTNDIKALVNGDGCQAALLSATGKVLADMHLYKMDNHIRIDVEANVAASLTDRLNKYVVIEDVTFKNVSSEYVHFGLFGPKAEDIVKNFKLFPKESHRHQKTLWNNLEFLLLAKNDHGARHFELMIRKRDCENFAKKLSELGFIKPIGYLAYEKLRIENGVLRFGIDITPDVTFPETRLDKIAASEKKGCYPGQEVVARTNTYKGHTKKAMRFRFSAEEVVKAGDKVFFEEKEIGWITSATTGCAIGYILKGYFNPGNDVMIKNSDNTVSAKLLKIRD
jgi:folate-binding protein YgfZ